MARKSFSMNLQDLQHYFEIRQTRRRVLQQLGALAAGVLTLGLPEEAAIAIARDVALDSMPETRHAVLQVLAAGGVVNTSMGARRVPSPTRSVGRARGASARRARLANAGERVGPQVSWVGLGKT